MKLHFPLATLLIAAVVATTGCMVPGGRNLPPGSHNLPPAQRLMEPGPGVGGPGPGVLPPMYAPMQAQVALPPVQVNFSNPQGMQVRWDVGGVGQYDSEPKIVPGRHNFPQGGIYRLKLTNIPGGRVGVELYPTLEIGPSTARTGAYLAHNAVPVEFNDEDFDQVLSGNFVTKVIYLPDPEFQELALARVDTLVSTRLDPGVDPVIEADRRGAILAIIRMGNKDEEMPGAGAAGEVIAATYHGGGITFVGGPPIQGMPTSVMMMAQPGGMPMGAAPSLPPNYVSGVTSPQWGMPMSGTPLGIPGPPHIPLGGPAGLQKHVMHNHTHTLLPGPTERINMHVQQNPGHTYPRPADQVYVNERAGRHRNYSAPPAWSDKRDVVRTHQHP